MRKKLNYILISSIIGLSAAILFIAFTGPGNKTPGEGSPDFWKVSDSGVYFNVSGKNVGIGTNNPQYLLDVNGGIRIGNTFDIKEGVIRYRSDQKQFEGYDGSNWIPFAGNWTDQGNYIFARNTTSPNIVVVDDNGNVGIGTTGPGYKLDVNGTINGTAVKVNGVDVLTSGPDTEAVLLTGDQTIAGVKTFSSIPVLPASDPTSDNQAVRKAYIKTTPTANKPLALDANAKFPSGNNLLGNLISIYTSKKTSSQSIGSSYTDVSGMSVTFTPPCNGKVIVMASFTFSVPSGGTGHSYWKLLKGTTQISVEYHMYSDPDIGYQSCTAIASTTVSGGSSVTFKLQAKTSASASIGAGDFVVIFLAI